MSYIKSLMESTDDVVKSLGDKTLGVGDGTAANVQAPAKGTGDGPATPGTVAKFLKVQVGEDAYWIPLMQ